MPLRVKCSAGHLMMVPDHRAGTVLRCAQCGIEVQVPAASGPAGTPLKEPTGPRVSPPAIPRQDPRQPSGPAARQSPRVAGHVAPAKPGIALPAVAKKPSLPKTGLPAQLAEAKANETPGNAKAEEPGDESPPALAGEPVAPPIPPAAETPAPPPPVVIADPPPPAKKLPAHQTPPLEPAPPRRREPEPEPEPSKPAKPSNRPRMTLTGTMISPSTESPPEPPVPPRPEPKPAAAKPAARMTDTQVDAPREKNEIPREKNVKPALKEQERPREVAAPSPASVSAASVELPTTQAPSHEPTAPEPLPEERTFHSAATLIEPKPPPQRVIQGVQPTTAQRTLVWQLAAALLAALLLSIGPSLWEISDYIRSENGHTVARWAFLLLMLGVVQFGCILLLVQVPDWSSVWIVTLQSLALAAIYAAVLGLTIITRGDSPLIGALQLDFQYSSGKAPPWCVCLAATYACLAFFAGRISAKWRKVLKQVQKAEEAAAGQAY